MNTVSTSDIVFFVVSGLAAVAALMLAVRAIESGNISIAVATIAIATAIEIVCWRYWMRRWRKR